MPIDYARPVGGDFYQWRHNARKTPLFQRGDMVLVWVNEADLDPLRDMTKEPTDGRCSPKGIATKKGLAVRARLMGEG